MLKTVTFEVIGENRLHCEGCEERVQKALKTLQGVAKVRAKSRNQRIEVLFDSALLDPTTIGQRIDKVGYQTRIVS